MIFCLFVWGLFFFLFVCFVCFFCGVFCFVLFCSCFVFWGFFVVVIAIVVFSFPMDLRFPLYTKQNQTKTATAVLKPLTVVTKPTCLQERTNYILRCTPRRRKKMEGEKKRKRQIRTFVSFKVSMTREKLPPLLH